MHAEKNSLTETNCEIKLAWIFPVTWLPVSSIIQSVAFTTRHLHQTIATTDVLTSKWPEFCRDLEDKIHSLLCRQSANERDLVQQTVKGFTSLSVNWNLYINKCGMFKFKLSKKQALCCHPQRGQLSPDSPTRLDSVAEICDGTRRKMACSCILEAAWRVLTSSMKCQPWLCVDINKGIMTLVCNSTHLPFSKGIKIILYGQVRICPGRGICFEMPIFLAILSKLFYQQVYR